MPQMKRRLPARRSEDLSPLVRHKLLCGIWFGEFLDGEQVSDDALAVLWDEHREELLAQHEREQVEHREAIRGLEEYYTREWADQPAWGDYVFSFAPRFGARRGVDPDDPNFGYSADARDGVESWKDYLERIAR